jgi:hypothetical protein
MMSNMAIMAQMASSMGLLGGPPAGQFPGGAGFPMQGVMPGDVGMYPGGGMNNGFPGPSQSSVRGMNSGGRGGRGGGGRGRGGHPTPSSRITAATPEESSPAPPAAQTNIVAPTTTPAATPALALNTIAPSSRPGYVPPDRPQSPTLCKFGPKCTNALCRFSHPSPVATAESGIVLSNEACEKGKDCKDKDCIKAHVSPAVLTAPGKFLSLTFQKSEKLIIFLSSSCCRATAATTPAATAKFSASACRSSSRYAQPGPLPFRHRMYASQLCIYPPWAAHHG